MHHGGPDTFEKHVPPALAIPFDHAFEHMDAADVTVVDHMHPQQQVLLAGVGVLVGSQGFFDMVDGPEVKRSLDFDHAELGTHDFIPGADEVAKVFIRHHRVHARCRTLDQVTREGNQHARQHREFQRQENGGGKRRHQDGAVPLAGAKDAPHLAVIEHPPGRHQQYASQGGTRKVGGQRRQQQDRQHQPNARKDARHMGAST